MKQLSVRGFDVDLEKKIREIAQREGISLNRAALLLLRKGAGLLNTGRSDQVVGNSLDHLMGKWTREDAREFLKAIEPLEQIDRSFWK